MQLASLMLMGSWENAGISCGNSSAYTSAGSSSLRITHGSHSPLPFLLLTVPLGRARAPGSAPHICQANIYDRAQS